MTSKKENPKPHQTNIILNNIIKELFITFSFSFSALLLLLNLLPILKTDYHKVSTYNGYTSLFFLQDRGDILYYSSSFLLFYHLFELLIFIASISYFFIKNNSIQKRIKILVLILFILSSILLLTSLILSLNTLTNIKVSFSFYLLTSLSFIFSIIEIILYLKDKKQKDNL